MVKTLLMEVAMDKSVTLHQSTSMDVMVLRHMWSLTEFVPLGFASSIHQASGCDLAIRTTGIES